MVERVKIFYTDDESLKLLGELLSNKTSRTMLTVLSEKPYYTSELSKKLDISVSLTIHHLTKLEELELVTITNQQIVKRGVDRRFFQLKSNIFISQKDKEVTEKTSRLMKIFKDGIKITSVLVTAGFLWFQNKTTQNTKDPNFDVGDIISRPFYEDSTFFPMLIIILALFGQIIYNKIKRKNKVI